MVLSNFVKLRGISMLHVKPIRLKKRVYCAQHCDCVARGYWNAEALGSKKQTRDNKGLGVKNAAHPLEPNNRWQLVDPKTLQ